MSNSIHPWILKDLKQYAEVWGGTTSQNLMKPPKGRKCQLVKFITPPSDDSSAAIWAYVSDKECWIPVKLHPEVVIVVDENPKNHEPLTSYLGSICTIRGITVTFTKVPLEGKKGLEEKESLILVVREVQVHGARGEPAFRMDVTDKGVQKRGDFISPHDDLAIGRWVTGLRTGNGHVLQVERVQKDEKAELEGERQTATLTPLATPQASTSRVNRRETREIPGDDYWTIPADQLELFERYNGRGPPTPGTDVFSDEEIEEEGPGLTGVNNPNPEQPSSPDTVVYSGWSSTPVRAPAFARGEGDDNREEGDNTDSDVEGDETAPGDIFSGEVVPCAQRPKPHSTFSMSLRTPLEEPFTQALPLTTVSPIPEPSQAELHLSFPSTSKDPENTGAEPKDRDSQISTISTIEPTSSNNVSCSAICPPAQRSFAKVDESQESHQDTGSPNSIAASSVKSFHSAAESQFSDVGIAGPIKLEEDEEAEPRLASRRDKGEDDVEIPLGRPVAGSPEGTRTPSPSLPEPEPGSVFDNNKLSSVTPAARRIVSSKLDDMQLVKHRRPHPMREPTTVLPLVRDGQGVAKRPRSELKNPVEGPNKRLKSDQAARRETPAASLFKNASVIPRTFDPYLEENHTSSSKNAPKLAQQRRPLLVGNGNDLTLWRALQKNPPPVPQRPQVFRPGAILPDYSAVRPPFLDLRKMKLGVKRSEKYRKSQDLSQ